MHILWMTLLACTGMALAAALEFHALQQDLWWYRLCRRWSEQQQELAHEYQRQQFHLVRRDKAYLGQRAAGPSVPRAGETAQLGSVRLHRIKLFPLNARLPLQEKLYFDSDLASSWQRGFWQLLDTLYGREPFYQQWRTQIDPSSFLKELFQELGRLAPQLQNPGSWGLSLVQFNDAQTQEVWLKMLRGSDRLQAAYPSLLGYLWPVDLVKWSVLQRLNLPYANFRTIAALLGSEFAIQWQERVAEIKEQAHPGDGESQQWVLDRQTYLTLYQQLCSELSIDAKAFERMLDFSPGPFVSGAEALIRDEQGVDHLASLQPIEGKG